MGDGHDCIGCADAKHIETHNKTVCAECGGTVREKEDKDGERHQRSPGQG